jgi:hypothetical protein
MNEKTLTPAEAARVYAALHGFVISTMPATKRYRVYLTNSQGVATGVPIAEVGGYPAALNAMKRWVADGDEVDKLLKGPIPGEQPCKGTNCSAVNGSAHSPECEAQHETTTGSVHDDAAMQVVAEVEGLDPGFTWNQCIITRGELRKAQERGAKIKELYVYTRDDTKPITADMVPLPTIKVSDHITITSEVVAAPPIETMKGRIVTIPPAAQRKPWIITEQVDGMWKPIVATGFVSYHEAVRYCRQLRSGGYVARARRVEYRP